MTTAELEPFESSEEEHYCNGWNACLQAIRSAIREYPYAGLDIEIAEAIDQIKQREYNRGYDDGWAVGGDV